MILIRGFCSVCVTWFYWSWSQSVKWHILHHEAERVAGTVGAGVRPRHLSRCDSDWKLAARWAADRCRGRGLRVTGDLKGSAVKRDHKAKRLCALGLPHPTSPYLTVTPSCNVNIVKGGRCSFGILKLKTWNRGQTVTEWFVVPNPPQPPRQYLKQRTVVNRHSLLLNVGSPPLFTYIPSARFPFFLVYTLLY